VGNQSDLAVDGSPEEGFLIRLLPYAYFAQLGKKFKFHSQLQNKHVNLSAG
jgi:hypothetical protein